MDLPAHHHGRWRSYTPSMCVRPCSRDGGHWVGCRGGNKRASLVGWRATPSCAAGERWWCPLWGSQQCPPTPRFPPTPVVSLCQRRNWSPHLQRYPRERGRCMCVLGAEGEGHLPWSTSCSKHPGYVTAPYMVVSIRNLTLSIITGHKVSTSDHVYMYLLEVVSLKKNSVSNVLWQSCVDYSIMYSDCISTVKVPYHWTPLGAGHTHTHFLDASLSDVSVPRNLEIALRILRILRLRNTPCAQSGDCVTRSCVQSQDRMRLYARWQVIYCVARRM